MENKQMADYTLTIKADSGYESTTEGRCTAEQYGQAIAALHGEAPQRKPWVSLTDEQRLDVAEIDGADEWFWKVCIAIEAKLRELNEAPQRKPLTDEMVLAAARMLSDRQAAACNVDCGDVWKLHGNDFIDDARAALEAAHGIKE